jgi:non-ribosomal peptide synthetase component E (peptide arylation enzyme)
VVGVQLPNTVEIVVAFLAIVRIGAIVAPFPVQYRAWELTHLSNVAQVRAFLDVAVVAYPDEVLGERACAIVVPRQDQAVTLAEIVAYLRNLGIATFKLPERLEIRAELPRNPLGKVLKRELRDELRQ